jgi:trans-aconitate methyltransferase
LDIGCGPGVEVTKVLAGRFDLTALDFSKTMIDVARPRVPNARFVCMSVTDISYRDEFDGVVASYCLLCLDPKGFDKACKNIVHALKPGGYAFVALNEAGSEDVTDSSAFIEINRQKMYSRAYSESEVRQAFCEMQVVGLQREVVRSAMYGTEKSILFLLRKPQRD